MSHKRPVSDLEAAMYNIASTGKTYAETMHDNILHIINEGEFTFPDGRKLKASKKDRANFAELEPKARYLAEKARQKRISEGN